MCVNYHNFRRYTVKWVWTEIFSQMATAKSGLLIAQNPRKQWTDIKRLATVVTVARATMLMSEYLQ